MSSLELFLFKFLTDLTSFHFSPLPNSTEKATSLIIAQCFSAFELEINMAEQVMEGKYYCITGAVSGIGRATAIRCAQLGAAGLTLCDLNMEGLETGRLM
jgi:hypothetical protein